MLSKRTYYALKALTVLAADKSGEPVMIGDLATRAGVPKRFLEQILVELKLLGTVNSKKGKLGGYYLSLSPREIHIGKIIRAIDGPIALLPCVSKTAYERCEECADENTCGLRSLMMDVREATAGILDGSTVADIIEREERSRAQQSIMFYI